MDKTNKQNEVYILPQMLVNNEFRDSLILQEKQRRQRENDREQAKSQQQRTLSDFLRNANDVTLEMLFEDWRTAYSKSQRKSKQIADKNKNISTRPNYNR